MNESLFMFALIWFSVWWVSNHIMRADTQSRMYAIARAYETAALLIMGICLLILLLGYISGVQR
jgi:hypothetical protein